MWRNYFTVGLRALTKNKTYALITILGLAIGMAACLMILMYVRYETTFDRNLPGAAQAFQFQTHYTSTDTGEEDFLQMSSYVTGPALEKDFPQIEKVVYALSSGPVVLKDGEAYNPENALQVNGNLFEILQLPFVVGNRETALDEVGSVVLTETEAMQRFGRTDILGETLTLVLRGEPVDYRVTGIVSDPPKNSHLELSMISRFDPQSYFAEQPDFLDSWGWQSGWVYVSLKPGADAADINSQMQAWEDRNIPDENIAGTTYNMGDEANFQLVNVRDIHLGEAQNGAMTPGNDPRTIATFAVIALLILAMACINFTNLATARASQRAREVALRKVLGADRKQLIVQFVGESTLVAAIAMLLALALVELLVPPFAAFLDADLSVSYLGEDGILIPMILLVLIVGLAGGLYPAFFLSRFQPASVLKANKSSSETSGSGLLRNLLVVGQFAISIGLIVCTLVIYLQTLYARTADPGYERDGILQVENIGRRQIWPVMDTMVREIEQIPGVTAVGRTTIGVSTGNTSNTFVQPGAGADRVLIGTYQVDHGYFDAMGIDLVAGRTFQEGRPMDDATLPYPEDPVAEQAMVERGINLVLNEFATRRLGFDNPKDAVGKQILTGLGREDYGPTPATIIGVVQDSRFRSIREPIEPIMFRVDTNSVMWMVVRYEDANPGAVREQVEAVWKQLAPDVPFDAQFSEEVIGDLYRAEDARAQIFAAFAVLAIIIACLGLFGLAAFTAERRTKEIGIRKVLGARTRDIVQLLAWQFSKPVLVANIIAWPVAWWLMRDWLNSFDVRIGLEVGPFLLAGGLALLIALGTVAGHAFRVARSDPASALRYE